MIYKFYLCLLMVSTFSCLSFFKRQKRKYKALFPILLLLSITVVVEIRGYYSLYYLNKPDRLVYAIFQPLEYILISLFFIQIIDNEYLKKVILISIPLVIILLISLFQLEKVGGLKGYYDFLLVALGVNSWGILYMYQLLTKDIEKNLLSNPSFWISTAILFFHTSAFVLMGLIIYLYQINQEIAQSVFSINHLLNIIYYSLITYAFYLQWKSTKSSSSSLEGH